MKKQILMIAMTALFCVGGVLAQKGEMAKMDMMEMQKNPHHALMTAYRENARSFSEALRAMAQKGMLTDVDAARSALAEVKRSVEKIDEIHKSQMGKMTPEMMQMMKPMMEKMQTEQTAAKQHIAALETIMQSVMPDAKEVETHAAALTAQFGKMKMMDDKMKKKNEKMKMSGRAKMSGKTKI